MGKLSGAISLLVLLLMTSCLATRQSKSDPKIPIADPVRISYDTLKLTFEHGQSGDTITDNSVISEDSIRIDTLAADLIPRLRLSSDSLRVSIPDSLLSLVDSVEMVTDDTIVIIGTGDIMPGTNYPDSRYLPPGNDCFRLFEPVASILQSADVTFGNLEGVFCSEGGTPKDCRDPKVCYVFRMPDEYLECILKAGYNLLSVANNHVNDFGYEGRVSTARLLEEAGVPFAGFQSKPSVIFQIDSIKYGFAAFAPHLGTVNLKDYEGAARIVAELDSVCDIVIVSFHGGAEGRDFQHLPCTDEEYLGYNRGNVCKFAHTVVDAGADVVFGHGPHVTRAMELYRERLICYSLGNFCTYARFNLSGPNGVAPIVKVYTNKSGEFLGGQVISVIQHGEGGPHLDSQHRALHLLRELTATDFPGNDLVIDENGQIYVRKLE